MFVVQCKSVMLKKNKLLMIHDIMVFWWKDCNVFVYYGHLKIAVVFLILYFGSQNSYISKIS